MNFEEDVIVSPANEYEVLQLLLADCRDRFTAYGGAPPRRLSRCHALQLGRRRVCGGGGGGEGRLRTLHKPQPGLCTNIPQKMPGLGNGMCLTVELGMDRNEMKWHERNGPE